MKTALTTVPRWTAIRLLARGVFTEIVRRQDTYVLFLMMALFALGVMVVQQVGVESPATGTFLLNLGMTIASVSAHVLTLLLALRQIPNELEHRTLYPLLARPIRRSDIVLAKWLAVSLAGSVVYLLLVAIGWSCVPKMESYAALTLAQMLLLQPVSLALIAALGMCLSLFLPKGVALVCGGGLFFLGNGVATALRRACPDALLMQWGCRCLPDFTHLNLTTRYTDGIAGLPFSALLLALVYGGVFAGVILWFAVALFERRAL